MFVGSQSYHHFLLMLYYSGKFNLIEHSDWKIYWHVDNTHSIKLLDL
jgi:hypothetical protein